MIYVVSYELGKPSSPTNSLITIDAIKNVGKSWMRLNQSAWLVESDDGVTEIRDKLKVKLREQDVIFVAQLDGNWASRNMGDVRSNWLKVRPF